jgi:hypothetical protein
MVLSYTSEGWLAAYEYEVLGMAVSAKLERMPPERSFGTALDAPLTGGTVREQDLP